MGLKSLGFTQVHGVDISKVALENLKEFKVSSWDEIKGKYGLVISHLVAQHTSNKDLLNELNTLRKHLVRRGGQIKIQFAFPYQISKEDYLQRNLIPSGIYKYTNGSNVRNFGEIIKLAELSTLCIDDVPVVNFYPEFSMIHLIVTYKRFKLHTETYLRFKNKLKNLLSAHNPSILESSDPQNL